MINKQCDCIQRNPKLKYLFRQRNPRHQKSCCTFTFNTPTIIPLRESFNFPNTFCSNENSSHLYACSCIFFCTQQGYINYCVV